MPLFPRKSRKSDEDAVLAKENHEPAVHDEPIERQRLVFYCQQAQGSPTGVISGFTNVKELYQKIGECYDFDPSEVFEFILESLYWLADLSAAVVI